METRADPAGDIRTIHELRDQNAAMQKLIEELHRKIQRLERKKIVPISPFLLLIDILNP